MRGMSRAVAESLGLIPKRIRNKGSSIAKSGDDGVQNIPQNIPPASLSNGNLTVYEEIHRHLTRAAPRPLSPQTCPYPDNLCRGCREFARCG